MGLTGGVMGEHRLDFASPPDDVSSVHDFLSDVWTAEPTVSVEDRMALELAIIELASNVIEHATAGVPLTCSLTLAVAPDALEARITDDGRPAAVDVAGATLPDELAESGRGLALVQMVVDELRYDRLGDENRWTVRKATRAG
jgi:serine/threonine-protein kinase RsbW